MTDDFEARLEASAEVKGWRTREGIAFDAAIGEVSDAMRWELDREEDAPSIAPTTVRYIKLGPGGVWFDRCVDGGLIELGHSAIPHETAAAGEWEKVRALYTEGGTAAGPASGFVRELRDFYTLSETALWITMGRGRLWWAFAERPVDHVSDQGRGSRMRKVTGRWRDTDIQGQPLYLSSLSTRLTKVQAYRQTICEVEAAEYLVRRINADPEPRVARAVQAQDSVVAAASDLIEGLDWRDFELLIDLIFAGSGWRRVSAVGGSAQADSDLILQQAVTGERAMVQVKSSASQTVLDDYARRFRESGCERLFFVCHSPAGTIKPPVDQKVQVWLRDGIAHRAVHAGLLDWLIEKCR